MIKTHCGFKGWHTKIWRWIGCAQKAENENKHCWSFKILNHSMKINNGKFNCDFPSAFGCDIGIGEHTIEQLLFTKPNNILFKPFDILITHIRTSGKFWKTLFSIVSSLYCLLICVRSFFNQNIYHFQTPFFSWKSFIHNLKLYPLLKNRKGNLLNSQDCKQIKQWQM